MKLQRASDVDTVVFAVAIAHLAMSTSPKWLALAFTKSLSHIIGLFHEVVASIGCRTMILAPNACLAPRWRCAARAGVPPSWDDAPIRESLDRYHRWLAVFNPKIIPML
jgi:hypothetical protein